MILIIEIHPGMKCLRCVCESKQRHCHVSRYESPHDKTNKMSVRPAKTQTSLGIRPVCQSLRCALNG